MVEGVRAKAAARLEEVAESAVDEHPHPRAVALQHRVGGDGGAVQEQRAVREQTLDLRSEPTGGEFQYVEHPAAGILRHRRGLEDVEPATGVHQHHVGEGSADVDRDAPRGRRKRSGSGHSVSANEAGDSMPGRRGHRAPFSNATLFTSPFLLRTTTVPASLSCHPCFLPSNATQMKPSPRGMPDTK